MAEPPVDEPVRLRHHRTEQTVTVTLGTYRRQAARRYRNWRLARGNLLPRPCLTVSECLLETAPEGDRRVSDRKGAAR